MNIPDEFAAIDELLTSNGYKQVMCRQAGSWSRYVYEGKGTCFVEVDETSVEWCMVVAGFNGHTANELGQVLMSMGVTDAHRHPG